MLQIPYIARWLAKFEYVTFDFIRARRDSNPRPPGSKSGVGCLGFVINHHLAVR